VLNRSSRATSLVRSEKKARLSGVRAGRRGDRGAHQRAVGRRTCSDLPEALLHIPVSPRASSPGTVLVNTKHTPRVRDALPCGRHGGVWSVTSGGGAHAITRTDGIICRAADFIEPDLVRETIGDQFRVKYPKLVEANLRTFDRGFAELTLRRFEADGRYPDIPFAHYTPPFGWANAPIGGTILNPGNTVRKDLSTSRQGFVPEFLREKCIDCGLCDMTCPDFCFQWEQGTDKRGRAAPVLLGIDYAYCKGCMKCVEVCPVEALVKVEETEDMSQRAVHLIGPPEALSSFDREGIIPAFRDEDESYWHRIS